MTKYLTRTQVAEIYPISAHTLAKLASNGTGPRFFKPTDKCLYRAEDIEAWIEAAAVMPAAPASSPTRSNERPASPKAGRGRAIPEPKAVAIRQAQTGGRKSLPPSPNSWLLRNKD